MESTVKVQVVLAATADCTAPFESTPQANPTTFPAVNPVLFLIVAPVEQTVPVPVAVTVIVPGRPDKADVSPVIAFVEHSFAKPDIVPISDPAEAFSLVFRKLGRAVADNTPTITITIISSTKVKPDCPFLYLRRACLKSLLVTDMMNASIKHHQPILVVDIAL